MARHIMIQGTSSSVGKSVLVTALCRIFSRRGISVTPFKAQNMALNSFVTPDGLEIGRSQAVQAQAANAEMSADMNPILLKPEGDSRSQVVVAGKPWKTLRAGEYYSAKTALWQSVTDALSRLSSSFDLIIAEGAGSPAEINLKAHEIVNMRVARHLSAPVLLAADIDRGGVFAFLYGTLSLLEEEERSLIKGFIINKFRGDVTLLEPGLKMLADLTGGQPTVGVIPYLHELNIAQEDSVFLEDKRVIDSPGGMESGRGAGGNTPSLQNRKQLCIAVVAFPRVSNYDDIDALLLEEGVQIVLARVPEDLAGADGIILPGTKTTVRDLLWLNESGMSSRIAGAAGSGTPVCGICGGYQMLGRSISDPDGVEGSAGEYPGLGLLPVQTTFQARKKTVRVSARYSGACDQVKCHDAAVEGYEIHMGISVPLEGYRPLFRLEDGRDEGAARGKCWGTYIHGVFDLPGFRRAWLRSLGWDSSAPARALSDVRNAEFDRLADTVEAHLDMKTVDRIIGL